MSDQDRFGLAGLLGMIYGENSDVSGLALGQDLMSLGLDLNQPEYVSSVAILQFYICSVDRKIPGRYTPRSHHLSLHLI